MSRRHTQDRLNELERRAVKAAAPISQEWIASLADDDVDLLARIATESKRLGKAARFEDAAKSAGVTPAEWRRLEELQAGLTASISERGIHGSNV